MPSEQGYDRQLTPQTAAAQPLTSPEDYGAGIGEAVGQLGATVHRAKVQQFVAERKVTADREAADFAKRWALQRQNMDGIVQQLRENPADPSYSTHAKQAGEALEAARGSLLEGITEDSVRRAAATQIDEFGAALGSRETTFAHGKATAKLLGDTSDTLDISANRVRRMQGEDPAVLATELKASHDLIGGLQNVDPETRKKLHDYADQTINTAFIQHLQDTNPQGAKALLGSGAFDFLPPTLLEKLRAGTDDEIRRADAAVKAEITAVKATYKDRLGAAKSDAAAGIDVSDRLPDLYKTAETLGDASDMATIKGIERDSRFAKVFKGVSPLARQSRLLELQRILPQKRSEDQQAELNYLVEKGPGLDSQFNSDPVGTVIRNGRPGEQPPPIDPANPASYAERAAWRERAVKQYGTMDLLSGAEVQARKARYGQGANGEKEVADDLARFGPAAAKFAAMQIAPKDDFLREVVRLPADTRDDAFEGKAAYSADKKLLAWTVDSEGERALQVINGYNKAFSGVPEAQRGAILKVAWNLAAHEVKKSGQPITGAVFERSLNRAIGAQFERGQMTGGMAGWTNRQFFWVPDGYTANRFAGELFSWLRKYPGEAAVNPDKTPLDLKQARPVRLVNGMYKFMIGDAEVKNKKGAVFLYQPGWR